MRTCLRPAAVFGALVPFAAAQNDAAIAAAEVVLHVPGVHGGASRAGYEGWIRLETYAVTLARDPSTGETHGSLEVSGVLDRSFPLMNVACARGTVLGAVRLELAGADRARQPLLHGCFAEARCVSVELLHESGRALRQLYSFEFADVRWQHAETVPRSLARLAPEATRELAADAVLRLDGIDGAAPGGGGIEVFASRAVVRNPDGSHPELEPMATAGFVDRSLAPVTRAMLDALAVPSATIRYVATGLREHAVLSIAFEDVVLESVQTSSLDGVLVQDHAFGFARITWTYTLLDASGAPAGQVTAGWDTVAGARTL